MKIEVKKITEMVNGKLRDFRWEIYIDGQLFETTDFDPAAFVEQLESDLKNGNVR